MSEISEMLDAMYARAKVDAAFLKKLLMTAEGDAPVTEFCAAARGEGFMLFPMDLIDAGEYFHAAMKRSTNGGGENSPMLCGQDDFYAMFMEELKRIR